MCRSVDVMKEHWRRVHQHLVGQSRGGSGIDRKEDNERQVALGCRKVSCQRFFPRGADSHYFVVHSVAEKGVEGVERGNDATRSRMTLRRLPKVR